MDNIQDYTYDPVFAIPLVDASISIDDLFEIGEFDQINVDDENLITLVYMGEVFSLSASDLFHINDQVQDVSFTGIDPVAGGSLTLDPKVFLISFDNSEILSYISFLEGNFAVTIQADELQQDGYDLTATYQILNSDNGSGENIGDVVSLDTPGNTDLSGSSINFDNDANFFQVEYTITISGNGNPVNAPYSINFSQSLTNLQFDLLEGYIDQIAFPIGNTSVSLGLFNNTTNGNIHFANPTIDFTFNNSFGAEIDLITSEFYAVDIDSDTLPLGGSAFNEPWRVLAAQTPEEGNRITNLQLNHDNTNLFEITGQSPRKLFYNVNGLINPDADGQTTNWIKHDSNLSIDMEVNLPLWGLVNIYELRDTTELTLTELPEELEWAEMKLSVSNEFPLGVNVQAIAVDENYQPLDTLFKDQPQFLVAAPVDPISGIVTEAAESTLTETISHERIELLKQATNIVLKASMNSWDYDNGSVVKILDNYRLGLKMGVRGKARITTEF